MPKKKNHAKEQGGIAAAVTKEAAAKFSNDSETSFGSIALPKALPISSESSPLVNSPDFKPTIAPTYNVNDAPSPSLDALSAPSVPASTAPNSMTNEWARAGLAGSPGNLISFMGESPPTQPSSYEDSGNRIHAGWAAQRAFTPSSASPPSSVRRPLSYHVESQYRQSETPPQTSAAMHRRGSVQSHYTHMRMGSQPPLPHQLQPHFFAPPDLDLNATPHAGMKAGDRGYFFGLDRLPKKGALSPCSDAVVLAGYEGGMEVYAVGKKELEPVARLKGLKGGVHYAKILPWTVDGANESLFPLVAVVLHGPVLPANPPDIAVQSAAASPRLDGAASPRSVYTGADMRQILATDSYQTSVQVYSLKTNKLIDTLLQSPKIPIDPAIPLTSAVFHPPAPSGAFSIQADTGTLAVCSGITGEAWIYQQLVEEQNSHHFTCTGKLWTSLQQSRRGAVAEETEATSVQKAASYPNPQTPIFALHGRWVAYCPPSPSAQITLKALVPVPILGRAPGVSSVTPPQLPPATSSVDLPISDTFVNKIMRETTQELISGAKWVGQQGMQAWNSYWNRPTSPPSQPAARASPQTWFGGRSPQNDPNSFPPTHGSSGQPAAKEPGLVSVVDLETLASSSTVHPLTTFQPPQGCSFLAFSPNATSLFTASSKGDIQTVWDLFRLQYTRSSPLQATLSKHEGSGPQVRQIAHFTRMTVARIVEVAWSEPLGERLAVVTERGTVHLLDMPFSAFMWPPPRRRKAATEAPKEPEQPATAASLASGAFGAAYQAAKPFVTRPRRSSANGPVASTGTFKDTAAQGGRVIAASISSSLGKTGSAINQLRQSGENRVSLPPGISMPVAGCVAWIRRRRSQNLVSAAGGLVRTFPCKTRQASTAGRGWLARGNKYKDMKLPLMPDDLISPAVRQMVDHGIADEYLDFTDHEEEGGNTMTLKGHAQAKDYMAESAIPHAEIESSAPYQPFHTDRRVILSEYSQQLPVDNIDSASALLGEVSLETDLVPKKKKKRGMATLQKSDSAVAPSASIWAFGQPIPATTLDLGLLPGSDDPLADSKALPPSAMERVLQYGEGEQIVVTTRRRRGAKGNGDEDGFFEDDCEVLDFADQRV